MKPGRYAVVRYVADPARNEPVNVGVVVWDDYDHRLRIDADAANRVVRQNPFLARDALLSLEAQLRDEVEQAVERAPSPGEGITRWLNQQVSPLLVSEPRMTTILSDDAHGLDETLDRLVSRLVVPRQRSGGGSTPQREMARALGSLIREHQVHTDRAFPTTRTGVPRTVDFFANSSTNVALDVLQFAIEKGTDVIMRADAEAHKTEDIRDKNHVEMWAYCHINPWEEMQATYSQAFKIMEDAGVARIFTSPEDAAGALRERIAKK